MLSDKLKRKLESIRKIPTIPIVINKVLQIIDNPNASAALIASEIERDQALTARILRVANSPFYGFARRISTIDLAVVVMGTNTIKEIVLGLVIQKLLKNSTSDFFNIQAFWEYSLFCGSSSRLLARKLGYRLAGEAFVAGLMHDIGILIIADNFSSKFKIIFQKMKDENISLIDAEKEILDTDHTEIGAFIGQKWNLPEQICAAILNHHTPYQIINEESPGLDFELESISQPLTTIVSLSEWFSDILNLKKWNPVQNTDKYYLSNELFDDLSEDDIYAPDSAFNILKDEIITEYEKAKSISM
jgi:HD-like signal output (HDOD) protein